MYTISGESCAGRYGVPLIAASSGIGISNRFTNAASASSASFFS